MSGDNLIEDAVSRRFEAWRELSESRDAIAELAEASNDPRLAQRLSDRRLFRRLWYLVDQVVGAVYVHGDKVAYDWSLSGFDGGESLLGQMTTAIKHALVYSGFTVLRIPPGYPAGAISALEEDMEGLPADMDYSTLAASARPLVLCMLEAAQFMQAGYGLVVPERTDPDSELGQPLLADRNAMNLLGSEGRLTRVGEYILLDVRYPRITGLTIEELVRFRQEEGEIFRIFNQTLKESVVGHFSDQPVRPDQLRDIVEKVDLEVRKLQRECSRIAAHSRAVSVDWTIFGICVAVNVAAELVPEIRAIIAKHAETALRVVSAAVGGGRLSDVVRAYRAKRLARLELSFSPYYWPFMLHEAGCSRRHYGPPHQSGD